MEKYFLGSVGKAEAFRKNANNEMELAFVSKTLTDSGLNISTTKDDIRAGQGAPIQFSFYHDPSVEITLTDVLWKKDYLTAQLGAEFSGSINEAYVVKTYSFTAGVSNPLPEGEMKKVPLPCGQDYLVWAAKKGTEDWKVVEYKESDKKIYLGDTSLSGEYCVRYLGRAASQIATINSLIVPEELFLVITAPIFSADACGGSRGTAAGEITFEIPRFVLNGAQEFAMNMSSNQNMSLAGTAMAVENIECDSRNGGKLLRVIEVLFAHDDIYENVISIHSDEQEEAAGKEPAIYAVFPNKVIKVQSNEYTVTPALNDGKYEAGKTYAFKLAEPHDNITTTVVIPE